ncbi:MAG: CaiB/BaiF CoA transferase family protein [Steroidobacteraceae bacterium]
MTSTEGGPLAGIRVLEMAGLGPAPYACMLLADLGAEVIRIERPDAHPAAPLDPHLRTRRSIVLDLKRRGALEVLLRLVETVDVLIEGYRPGVAERLGFGPEVCLKRNARLVYGRVTGWGQAGPLAKSAGHDINYLALSGLLHQLGPEGGNPQPPLNVVADYGGGGMLLALGVVTALFERSGSGKGQVVDATMLDGLASFMGTFLGLRAAGSWQERPGGDFLSGGAHYYGTYPTRDGKWVAVGAIEPAFHEQLITRLGLDVDEFRAGVGFAAERYPALTDDLWPKLRRRLGEAIASRSREELEELFSGVDACITPVLDLDEALAHPHHRARGTYIEVAGVPQGAPAPRFSRSRTVTPRAPVPPGQDTQALLRELGLTDTEIALLGKSDPSAT